MTDPLIMDGIVFFNTLIPGSDPCVGGSGRSYALDAVWGLPQDGMTTAHMSSVGMLSAPVVLLMDARVSDRNAIGRRSVKKKYTVFNFGTGGAKGTAAPATNSVMETLARAGRFSWREILNWQELRNAMGNK